ncbi:hypothetical protein LTR53_010211 [Teratosphaeriaceae sp. CCFEE 6253]|nr:hypothetical protein LTR53_010211 [Teratosphaeriaceae sp. CCFEE 6253]
MSNSQYGAWHQSPVPTFTPLPTGQPPEQGQQTPGQPTYAGSQQQGQQTVSQTSTTYRLQSYGMQSPAYMSAQPTYYSQAQLPAPPPYTQAPVAQPEAYSQRESTQYQQPQLPAPLVYTPAPIPQTPAQYNPIEYTYSTMAPAPEPQTPAPPQATTTTTTVTTQQYEGSNAGGEARQRAEARGSAALQQYDVRVEQLLNVAQETCPERYPWFNMNQGWICGGGTHFIHPEVMDDVLLGRSRHNVPRIDPVNAMNSFGQLHAIVHPPDVAHDMPMHNAHRMYMRALANRGSSVQSHQSVRRGAHFPTTSEPCACVARLSIAVIDDERTGRVARFPRFAEQGYFIGAGSLVSGPRDVSRPFRER